MLDWNRCRVERKIKGAGIHTIVSTLTCLCSVAILGHRLSSVAILRLRLSSVAILRLRLSSVAILGLRLSSVAILGLRLSVGGSLLRLSYELGHRNSGIFVACGERGVLCCTSKQANRGCFSRYHQTRNKRFNSSRKRQPCGGSEELRVSDAYFSEGHDLFTHWRCQRPLTTSETVMSDLEQKKCCSCDSPARSIILNTV